MIIKNMNKWFLDLDRKKSFLHSMKNLRMCCWIINKYVSTPSFLIIGAKS